MPQKDHNPIPNTIVVIVCGTLVAQWYAEPIYGATAKFIRQELGYQVRILAIPDCGIGSIDAAGDKMAQTLLTDYPDPETRFILLGHSQGGSHAVGLARRLGKRAIRSIIPLSAPHHGTRLASLSQLLPFIPAAFREMGAHSEVLHRLREAEEAIEELGELEVVSIMTFFDAAVWPFSASLLKEAENIVLAPTILHPVLRMLGLRRSKGAELVNGWVGHVGIIKHPAVLAAIKKQIRKLEAAERARAEVQAA